MSALNPARLIETATKRSLKTRVGELRLKKPQFREISFETKVFDRYSRVEKALVNAIIESYL